MALDREDMLRRRHQRQVQRRKQQRKNIFILSGAGIALCAIVILIIVLVSSCNKKPQPSVESTDSTTPPSTVIHLGAVGDLNVTQAVTSSGSNYDYKNTFMDIAHLLANPDVTLLNFEGNLYGEPYGTDRSAPQSMAQALDKAGVDIVQLANSYSIYKGMDGLSNTISGFRSAGIAPLGVHASAESAKNDKHYALYEVNGIKIAFVAFTKGMDGMALPAGYEGCVNVLYKDYSSTYQEVDSENITKILKQISKEKPDLTVAMLHWGSEFNDTISKSQKEICSLLQENGVDAILGTHSHYVQKMEFDQAAGTFVAYSLGDFIGDADRSGSEYSVVLDLEITKDGATGETKITGYSYTPIFTIAEEGKPLRVVRIQEAIAAYEAGYIDRVSEATYEAMKYALDRIEARIHEE